MLVIVQGGADRHNHEEFDDLKAALLLSCTASIDAMGRPGADALTAAEKALKILEDCPYTNADTGSFINEHGVVQCEASIMDCQTGLLLQLQR